jgi:predicted cupin superfamily sugar epimerase
MTADEIKALLGLEPHPIEGGHFRRTYTCANTLYLPRGMRPMGTAIYYLLEPGTFSEMHVLASDEIFHFYLGDPIEMLQLTSPGIGRVVRIGNNLAAGERPQVVVPRGVWQGSRLVPGGAWALIGCTVSPGFEFEDYDAATRAELCAAWPAFTSLIHELTRAGS